MNKITKKETTPKIILKHKYQKFINGKKVVIEATSLQEANKLFKKLIN